MTIHFTVNEGKVSYLMRAGNDYVKGEMTQKHAEKIYAAGSVKRSRKFAGYPVCVDGIYFFAGTMAETKKENEPCEE